MINSAASGVNCWVTGGLAGTYNVSEQSQILGPIFDFSSWANPSIMFSIWWECEFNYDGLVLQSSINGGTSWQNVGIFGDPNNWYSNNSILGLAWTGLQEGWSGSGASGSGTWVTATHALTGLAGQSNVLLRFAFGSDGSVQYEGVAIDDIVITAVPPPTLDTGVISIDSPAGTVAAATYPVTVTVQNFGTAPQANIPLDLVVDGGAPISETYVPTIAPGTSATYTFTAMADLSTGGAHTIQSYTTLPGDGDPLNDGTTITVQSLSVVSAYPYVQDFEMGPGAWFSGGALDSWAFGTPAKPVINSAASGVNCWVTGGLAGQYPNNEQSFLTGPIFDFTTLTTPVISFNIWWESEFSWDGAVLQSSIDGGMSWQNVGMFGDPGNWYTDNTIVGLDWSQTVGAAEGWTGRTTSSNGSSTWVNALHVLNGLGGQSSVLLRFAFGTDGSVQWEGVAFDDIVVNEANVPYPGTPGGDVLLGTGVNALPTSGLNQFVEDRYRLRRHHLPGVVSHGELRPPALRAADPALHHRHPADPDDSRPGLARPEPALRHPGQHRRLPHPGRRSWRHPLRLHHASGLQRPELHLPGGVRDPRNLHLRRLRDPGSVAPHHERHRRGHALGGARPWLPRSGARVRKTRRPHGSAARPFSWPMPAGSRQPSASPDPAYAVRSAGPNYGASASIAGPWALLRPRRTASQSGGGSLPAGGRALPGARQVSS